MRVLKAVSNPYLDHRLPWDTKTLGFAVQGLNHPDGKIDVDPLLLTARSSCIGKIEIL